MARVSRWSVRRSTAAVVAVALAAVACSSDVPGSEEIVTLRVMLADDWASAPAVADAISRFEAATPQARVVLQGVPFAQIPDALESASETGRTIDVVQWHPFALAELGLADEVGDLWESHGMSDEDWLPGALEDVTWEGGRYGIPLDTNAMVLLTNTRLLADAELSAPDLTRPQAIADAAAELSEDQPRGLALPSSGWVAYGWVRAFGGELVVLDDDTADITFDDPAVADALEFLAAMVSAGHAEPPRARDVSTDAMSMFQGGQVAMHTSGSWDVAAALRKANPAVELTVVPVPTADRDGGTVLGGSSLAVVAGTPNRELAFELMLALVDDEASLAYARDEGRLPARRALLDDPFFQAPEFRTVVDALPDASADRIIAFPRSSRAFKEAFEDVLLGRATATEALARAQRIADDELASRS